MARVSPTHGFCWNSSLWRGLAWGIAGPPSVGNLSENHTCAEGSPSEAEQARFPTTPFKLCLNLATRLSSLGSAHSFCAEAGLNGFPSPGITALTGVNMIIHKAQMDTGHTRAFWQGPDEEDRFQLGRGEETGNLSRGDGDVA